VEGANAVVDSVLKVYRRIRGSDFANKLLARGDKSYAIATRTEIQAMTGANRKKQKVEPKQDISVLDTHHSLEEEIAFEAKCAANLMAFTSCYVDDYMYLPISSSVPFTWTRISYSSSKSYPSCGALLLLPPIVF
jgi:hypothetical protein